jgi:hypothetical protein
MLLQSTLLDEQQVFISKGIGGQGQKLRYFVVLRLRDFQQSFTNVQQQLIESELKFCIKKYDGVFEEIDYEDGFAKALFLMPLKSNIQEMFSLLTDECNNMAIFLMKMYFNQCSQIEISEIRDFK